MARWSQWVLAKVAAAEGDPAAAARHLAEGIALEHEMGERRSLAMSLEVCASLVLAAGDPGRALWLAGSADGLRASIGAVRFAEEASAHESYVAVAREAVGDDAAQLALATGRHAGVDAAVEAALGLLAQLADG